MSQLHITDHNETVTTISWSSAKEI